MLSKPTTPFVEELRHKMARLKYTPLWQQLTDSYISQHLQDCEFVFVRNDAVRQPLTPAYQGPLAHWQAPHNKACQHERHCRYWSDQSCISGEETVRRKPGSMDPWRHSSTSGTHSTTDIGRLLCRRPDPAGVSLSLKTVEKFIFTNWYDQFSRGKALTWPLLIKMTLTFTTPDLAD